MPGCHSARILISTPISRAKRTDAARDWIGGARAGLLPVKPMETAARSPANFRNPVPGFAEDHFRPFAPQLAGQRQIISSKSSQVLYGHLRVTTCRFIPVYSR